MRQHDLKSTRVRYSLVTTENGSSWKEHLTFCILAFAHAFRNGICGRHLGMTSTNVDWWSVQDDGSSSWPLVLCCRERWVAKFSGCIARIFDWLEWPFYERLWRRRSFRTRIPLNNTTKLFYLDKSQVLEPDLPKVCTGILGGNHHMPSSSSQCPEWQVIWWLPPKMPLHTFISLAKCLSNKFK
jgi:hypothetical protein